MKGQRNRQGKPSRTDFGLGGADIITLTVARERALEYRRLAKQGLNPKYHRDKEVPCFEEVARQVHIERLPTWKNPKHGQQWINTLADYAFPKIGRLPVSEIDQPEVLQVLSPIWAEKHETARRVAQRMKIEGVTVHGFRSAFRDWAAEEGNHPREVAELSLGHKVGSEVERAYARSDLLSKRRELMESWNAYVRFA